MRASGAESALTQYLAEWGLGIESLDAQGAVAAIIGFYRSVRADDVEMAEDGDMLLFQWGTYGWNSAPKTFQYNITRQFISGDDDEMSQLQLIAHFEPTAETTAAGSGNQWCERPDRLPSFEEFILASAATAVADGTPVRVEIDFGLV